jgi:hypothetical protein
MQILELKIYVTLGNDCGQWAIFNMEERPALQNT